MDTKRGGSNAGIPKENADAVQTDTGCTLLDAYAALRICDGHVNGAKQLLRALGFGYGRESLALQVLELRKRVSELERKLDAGCSDCGHVPGGPTLLQESAGEGSES